MRDANPASAAALAEELLDLDPDDVEALLMVADAAPRYGHAEVGMLAAAHARARGGQVGAVEAAALLAACEVDRALASAEDALRRDPANARAYAIRGQALDLLGRPDEARSALTRAWELRPDAFPLPLPASDTTWDGLLPEVLSSLDPDVRDLARTVDIRFADLPELSQLRALAPPASPLVDALLHEQEGSTRMCVTFYRRNLARGARSLDELAQRMREALASELALVEDVEP